METACWAAGLAVAAAAAGPMAAGPSVGAAVVRGLEPTVAVALVALAVWG